MGWIVLNAALTVSADSMPCEGGAVTATVTVSGKTDDTKEVNSYTASIRDDYIFPDILWQSEPQSVGPGSQFEETFSVEISCDRKCHVIGPHGSSGERTAELYAYAIGEGVEGASDEVPVTCIKHK